MLLEVVERFNLLGILPKEGNILTMKLVQGLSDLLGFDEDEQKAINFKQEEGRVTWDPKVKPQELDIGELAHDVIRDALKKLSDEQKLPLNLVALFDKFVNAPKPKPVPKPPPPPPNETTTRGAPPPKSQEE